MKQKSLCLLLALSMILPISACKKSPSTDNIVPPGENANTDLVIGQGSDVVNPDPHQQNDTNSNRVIRMMYDSLLHTDLTGAQQPALAESWTRKSDNQVEFTLRRNVKFHNGYDFTAADVKFSLDRQKSSPKVRTFVEAITDVQVVDDFTVVITTDGPYAPLLYNLSATQSSIICKKHWEELEENGKKYASAPVGTGPMKFKSWTPNDRFIVDRYQGYWGEKAETTSVEMRVIPESSSQTIALETGEIDLLESVPAIDIPRVLENNKLKHIKMSSSSVTFASFNLTKKPFDDLRVRQALSHAVNKQAIIDVICEGYATPINTIFPTTMPSYDEKLNLYPYDLEKARGLLADAGYPSGFNIEMATSGDERNRIAQLMQSDFGKVGVTLDIQLLEWGAYLEYIGKKNHQMYIVGWSSTTEPDSSTTPLFHTKSGGPTGNRSWYSNEKVDKLIELGRTTLDWAAREPIYKQIQQQVMADAVWIPLFAKQTIIAMKKDLQGVQISPVDAHVFVYAKTE